MEEEGGGVAERLRDRRPGQHEKEGESSSVRYSFIFAFLESSVDGIDVVGRSYFYRRLTSAQEVPDYMIDNISFAFMHDPVITRSGQSYERSTIEKHLQTSPTDPMTRETLHKSDLRPNLALKQACEEFLSENGWAVDW